jgi:hypothetical protein
LKDAQVSSERAHHLFYFLLAFHCSSRLASRQPKTG